MKIIWTLINLTQLVVITLITIISSVIGITLSLFYHKVLLWIGRYIWGPILCNIVGAKIEVIGINNIKKFNSYIFTANHQSFLDIPILFSTSRRNLYFVAKKELLNMPFIGQAIWVSKMIFIDRSNREKAMASMKKAGELILNGKNVITFPEGTRSIDGTVKIFKRGSFIIAIESNIPIVPVAIKGVSQVWPGKSYKFRPGKVKIIYGEPIYPSDSTCNTAEELAEYVRQKVIEMLKKN
ncbi:MAG: lysophospholipid acyltransferase family protein [Flavobacteriales bacterium]